MKIIILFILLMLQLNVHARGTKQLKLKQVSSNSVSLVVSPPINNEVCFSPNEPCELKLIKFIESAQKKIDIAIYSVNLETLIHTLLVKMKDGIKIRVLVDKTQSKGKSSLVSTLVKAGIKVKIGKQKGYMHNKFTIIDSQRIETGSFNYTHHATHANQENQIYINTPEIVNRFQAHFDKIWSVGTDF